MRDANRDVGAAQLSAGRELDALVAEKVFGVACIHDIEWTPREDVVAANRRAFVDEFGQEPPPTWEGDIDEESDYAPKRCKKCLAPYSGCRIGPVHVPPYSTFIADAWSVVEKAIDYVAATTDFDIATGRPTLHKWELWFGERGAARYGKAFADTAPLAICLAALKAVAVSRSASDATPRTSDAASRPEDPR